MSEEFIPSLTLDPNPTAAAVQEAPAEVEVEEKKEEEAPVEKLELSSLSPAEQAAVLNFAEQIDVTNTEQILNYGSAAQKNISEFSDAALNTVRTKDLGEAGDMLSDLVVQLQGLNFEPEEKKGLRGLFKKSSQNIATLKAQYDKAEVNVDKIVEELEKHEITLLKDISMMDKMYDKNSEYQKELTMYILAGKLKIEHLRSVELPELIKKAEETGLPEDAQAAKDLADKADRFEKKLYDLELTRNISIQMAPQIRLIQSSNQIMAEKIQTSLVNTIPLWKSQMVLALGLAHTEHAMKAQRAVTDLTNDLLTKNAEKLHMATVETAKEAERGMVDIETLKHTNKLLIDTMDEVLEIQQQGKEKRRAAEQELATIEGELRAKILEARP